MRFLPVGDKAFDLAETCVTNAEYKAFVEATQHTDQWPLEKGARPDDDRPATHVSALDAEATLSERRLTWQTSNTG